MQGWGGWESWAALPPRCTLRAKGQGWGMGWVAWLSSRPVVVLVVLLLPAGSAEVL